MSPQYACCQAWVFLETLHDRLGGFLQGLGLRVTLQKRLMLLLLTLSVSLFLLLVVILLLFLVRPSKALTMVIAALHII